MTVIHHMRLKDAPFQMIKSGDKTIELRLCDDKRARISVGDEILFSHYDDPAQVICTQVVAIHHFPSFDELYHTLPLLKCGYTKDDVAQASPRDMDLYYPQEKQVLYGVLGIEIIRKA